jgi:hypothetical protein
MRPSAIAGVAWDVSSRSLEPEHLPLRARFSTVSLPEWLSRKTLPSAATGEAKYSSIPSDRPCGLEHFAGPRVERRHDAAVLHQVEDTLVDERRDQLRKRLLVPPDVVRRGAVAPAADPASGGAVLRNAFFLPSLPLRPRDPRVLVRVQPAEVVLELVMAPLLGREPLVLVRVELFQHRVERRIRGVSPPSLTAITMSPNSTGEPIG